MISRILNLWHFVKSSLWFVPVLFCVLYMAATAGIYAFEVSHLQGLDLPPLFFSGTIDDAKSIVVALLSSMITMATLAISITMIVLSLSASQLGPRLIRAFMSDRQTQSYIGLFFGTVVSCFILTVILHDIGAQSEIVPRLSISMVLLLCFFNLFVLLGFVHHVAQSCIADQMIITVSETLMRAINRLTDRDDESLIAKKEKLTLYGDKPPAGWPKDFERRKQEIAFRRAGYIQFIDYKGLAAAAQKHGLYIQLKIRAGKFVVESENGVFVYVTQDKLNDDMIRQILNCFGIGGTRTPTQDIEYSIRHLVEIGLRALSPGINDNFTAIAVLDRLSAALVILFRKRLPQEWFYDEEDTVRVYAQQSDEHRIVMQAFNQIRFAATDKPDILYHMLRKMDTLVDLAETAEQKNSLNDQLDEISHLLNNMNGILQNTKGMKQHCKELQDRLSA